MSACVCICIKNFLENTTKKATVTTYGEVGMQDNKDPKGRDVISFPQRGRGNRVTWVRGRTAGNKARGETGEPVHVAPPKETEATQGDVI